MQDGTILSEYSELINGIFHYQDQQVELRFVCLKLVLGTFAIIGGLAIYNIGLTNTWLTAICALLPMIALVPLTVILYNDLLYREKLKMGFFFEAIKYETKYPWLPAFHKYLVAESDIHDVPGTKQVSFYFGCAAVLMTISAIAISLFPRIYGSYYIALVGVLFLMAYFLYFKLVNSMLKKTKELVDVEKMKTKEAVPMSEHVLSFVHAKGKEYIEHFSKIKMRYKNLVMGIMSAVMLAYIYIIANPDSYVHINKIYLISFMAMLAVVGSDLIRFLDVSVSHVQMRQLFQYLVDFEKENKELSKPYVKIAEFLYDGKRDPVFLDFMYYFSINLSVMAFGLVVLIAKIQAHHSLLAVSVPIAFLVVYGLGEVYSLLRLRKKSNQANKKIKSW